VVLPEVIKLSSLLFNDCSNQCVCCAIILCSEEGPYLTYAACRVRKFIDTLTELSLMTTDKKILYDSEDSVNFCGSVIDIFAENKWLYGHKYKVQ
jgi:hypothetical protein